MTFSPQLLVNLGISLLATISSVVAFAKPRMVTTTTDLAWMAKEIAGPDANVESLLTGSEDPHFVDARPDYIKKVSTADAVCLVGLDLEVGWMPKVLSKSGRAHLQPGGSGYCETGSRVKVLEKLAGPIDRSMGDVHPSGNPHFWLSPLAMAEASDEVTETLSRIDPKNSASYRTRAAAFKSKMNELTELGRKKFADSKVTGSNARFLEYHREFSYFANAFGLESRGSIEEKPGISPSAGRIASVSSLAKSDGIKIVLASPHAQRRSIARFQELTGLKVNTVAVSINANGAPPDYPSLLQAIQAAVIESANREIAK